MRLPSLPPYFSHSPPGVSCPLSLPPHLSHKPPGVSFPFISLPSTTTLHPRSRHSNTYLLSTSVSAPGLHAPILCTVMGHNYDGPCTPDDPCTLTTHVAHLLLSWTMYSDDPWTVMRLGWSKLVSTDRA